MPQRALSKPTLLFVVRRHWATQHCHSQAICSSSGHELECQALGGNLFMLRDAGCPGSRGRSVAVASQFFAIALQPTYLVAIAQQQPIAQQLLVLTCTHQHP